MSERNIFIDSKCSSTKEQVLKTEDVQSGVKNFLWISQPWTCFVYSLTTVFLYFTPIFPKCSSFCCSRRYWNCCSSRIWMNEIREEEKKGNIMALMAADNKYILFKKRLIFRRTAARRKEKRTLVKNRSHWRYETQFIHASLARLRRRLTTEWFGTSVNLSKWASCQIFATAPALNNLLHFSFIPLLSTVRSPNHCYCAMKCVSFHMEPCSLKTRLWGMGEKRETKIWRKKYSFHCLSLHSHSSHWSDGFNF